MGARKLVQSFLKVGAGPYRDRADVYMRLPDGRIFGGRWRDGGFAVPGGGVDPGEDPAQAAIREALEESGYAATEPKVLDVPPTVRDWSPEHLAKLPPDKRLFAGSRTHYVTARLAGEAQAKKKNLDKWEATQRGFYTPQEALNINNEALTPYSKPHWEATQKVLQRFLNESVLPNSTVKTAVTRRDFLKVLGASAATAPEVAAQTARSVTTAAVPAKDLVRRFLFKAAAPRWVELLRQGALSPQATQRITQSMSPGSFRYVKTLGSGSHQLADLVAGNVGGEAGLMVRKLPLRTLDTTALDLKRWYQPLAEETQRMNRLVPGVAPQPLAATPLGFFQQPAQARVPAPLTFKQKMYNWLFQGRDPALAMHARDVTQLQRAGFTDLSPFNFKPGGQAYDFVVRARPEVSVNPVAGTSPVPFNQLGGFATPGYGRLVGMKPSAERNAAGVDLNAVRRHHALRARQTQQ